MKKVLVVGSINIDLVNYVKRFPKIGETIEAIKFQKFHGGKGANQAVAAKRLSVNDIKVSLFGKVHNGADGEEEIRHLSKNGIDTKYIFRSKIETGTASITISKNDEDNNIVIFKGANSDFSEQDKKQLEKAIADHDDIILQMETNNWLISNALEISKKLNKNTFFNVAPADDFKTEWLKNIDWVIFNESELELVSEIKITSVQDVKRGLGKLAKEGLSNAIVTLGENGSYIFTQNIQKHLPTKKVVPVDTTAAGDTFIGCFVSNLSTNVEETVNLSMKASSITIQQEGAQSSIPRISEL